MPMSKNDHTTTITRRQAIRAGGAALVATVPTATTVSADADPGGLSRGILADGFDDVEFSTLGFIRGRSRGYSGGIGPQTPAETLADRMRNEFNANSDAWIRYGNWLLEETETTALGSATVAVDVSLSRRRWFFRAESVPTAIHVKYDDDAEEFVDLDWADGEPADPDYQVEVMDDAAENAADELQQFRRMWIDEDGDDHEIPDGEYLSRLAGRYGSFISLGARERSVLELLVGEVDL